MRDDHAQRLHGEAVKQPAAARVMRIATSGVAWGIAASIILVAWTLVGLQGSAYYATPLAVRGYAPGHRMLRPSGPVGQSFGVIGTVLMLVPFAYMARKRIKRLRPAGTLGAWLEIHLFCGIVGPVLVTLHTSFKFNGIISAAYWSMVMVVLSGFVGRYLYVRIPRSIRGNELTRAEVDAQADALRERLADAVPSAAMLQRIERFQRETVPATEDALSVADLLFGEISVNARLRRLDRELAAGGLEEALRHDVVRLAAERAMLLRRTAYLKRTKTLFEYWHVFHLPLVYLLLVIAAAHIAVALYLGYVPFRW